MIQYLHLADKQLRKLHDEDASRFEIASAIVNRARELALKSGHAEAAKLARISGLIAPSEAREIVSAMLATLDDETLSVANAAKRLKVSPDTVLGWIHSGALRASNVGKGERRGRYRINPTDLDAFMVSRQKEKKHRERTRKIQRASFQRDFS